MALNCYTISMLYSLSMTLDQNIVWMSNGTVSMLYSSSMTLILEDFEEYYRRSLYWAGAFSSMPAFSWVLSGRSRLLSGRPRLLSVDLPKYSLPESLKIQKI